jgi:hypothetical protein
MLAVYVTSGVIYAVDALGQSRCTETGRESSKRTVKRREVWGGRHSRGGGRDMIIDLECSII